jgi:hypothetical protein
MKSPSWMGGPQIQKMLTGGAAAGQKWRMMSGSGPKSPKPKQTGKGKSSDYAAGRIKGGKTVVK